MMKQIKQIIISSVLMLSLCSIGAQAAGRIQNEDVKSVAEVVAAGGTAAQTINDTKIYVTGNSLNKQLSQAIIDGDLAGGAGGGGINLLSKSNFDFEKTPGTTNWTASGGTFSIISAGANLANGNHSASWVASGSGQTLTSALVAVPKGLQDNGNCLVKIGFYKYTGAQNDYLLEVIDQSSVVIASYLSSGQSSPGLAPASSFSQAYMGFSCSSATTSVAVRLKSNVVSPGTIYIDDVHLGSNILLSNIAAATRYGSLVYPGTSGCSWSLTSSSFADFPAQTSCSAPTVTGKVSAPSTKVPQLVLSNAEPGIYVFSVVTTATSAEDEEAVCQLVDNLGNVIGNQSWVGSHSRTNSSSLRFPTTIVGSIEYTAGADRTFKMQCRTTSAGSLQMQADVAGKDFTVNVLKFPNGSSAALASVDATGWYSDTNIKTTDNSDFALSTSAVSSYTGMTNANAVLTTNAGSLGTFIACATTENSSGATCSGNESNGIALTIPKPGVVMACANFSHRVNATDLQTTFQIVETGNNNQTVLQNGNSRMVSGDQTATNVFHPENLCGIFPITTAAQKHTFRLFYTQSATGVSSNSVMADDGSGTPANGNRDVHWVVFPLAESLPMPLLVKQLQSTSSAIMQHATAYISNNGTPAVVRQDGSWISGVSKTAAGKVVVSFVASTFSATPNCAFNPVGVSSARIPWIEAASSSAITTRIMDQTFTGSDTDFSLLCTGPK